MYGNSGLATWAGVAGAVGLVVAIYDYANVSSRLDGVDTAFASAEVGAGLIVCIIGFAVLTACAFKTRAELVPHTQATDGVPPSSDGSY